MGLSHQLWHSRVSSFESQGICDQLSHNVDPPGQQVSLSAVRSLPLMLKKIKKKLRESQWLKRWVKLQNSDTIDFYIKEYSLNTHKFIPMQKKCFTFPTIVYIFCIISSTMANRHDHISWNTVSSQSLSLKNGSHRHFSCVFQSKCGHF